ncbi:MAG: DUF2878 domain-containing protein [Pseudomonadota bacterium]
MLYILNFIAFQIGWFSSVFGGAKQMPWLGPAIVMIALVLHFYFARRPLREVWLVIGCAAMGTVFDSILVVTGWVAYPSGMLFETMAPYWIISMWMLFATTLNVSMRWLRGREALAAVFGFIGGPLAYIAGQKIGGIELIDPVAALLTLGIGWAVMMPILLRMSETFDGFGDLPRPRMPLLERTGSA